MCPTRTHEKKAMDARIHAHTTLTELRKRGVGSVQDKKRHKTVALALGINRVTLYGWLFRYRDGGVAGLDARKRAGRKPKLNAKAIQWV
jgi:transposase